MLTTDRCNQILREAQANHADWLSKLKLGRYMSEAEKAEIDNVWDNMPSACSWWDAFQAVRLAREPMWRVCQQVC